MSNTQVTEFPSKEGMSDDAISDYLQQMPDDVLRRITFAMPWQYDSSEGERKDPDGFPTTESGKEDSSLSRLSLQQECWRKFQQNPQVNTAVRGLTGRLTGMGFEVTSELHDIQQVINQTSNDWRNRLYNFWPKYIGRHFIEGELFLMFTLHSDGFVEIDFIDPTTITTQGTDGTGIVFHPRKALLPVFYNISTGSGVQSYEQVPSIYVARSPNIVRDVRDLPDVKVTYQRNSKTARKAFEKLGGFYRFVVGWDKGFMTKRSISYLRTTLIWLNHYENLKQYEIDHKKSSGAYVWAFKITEPRMFKIWLGLTDEEKRKTGIMSKKTPGSSLVLPPGMEMQAVYPQLSKISQEDTDILHMVTSGLNEPEDVSTGANRGTYANVKATRGPMSDRTSDEIAYFERFLRHDFFGSIFFLRSAVTRFPSKFKVREAKSFDENGEPEFGDVFKTPEELIDISFPVSETLDMETRAKGMLGTKHGPISEQVGIPQSEVAKRMGFGGYGRLRLRKATEDEKYPELKYEGGVDAESAQEKAEGEQGKTTTTKKLVDRPVIKD